MATGYKIKQTPRGSNHTIDERTCTYEGGGGEDSLVAFFAAGLTGLTIFAPFPFGGANWIEACLPCSSCDGGTLSHLANAILGLEG